MANNLLFQVPQRDADKQSIKDTLNKAKSKKKSPTTVRGGGGISNQIATITYEVGTKLGQYKDKYQLIQSDEILHDYITECIGNGYISIDTETTGLDPLLDQLAGICIYTRSQKGSYIPINHVGYISGEKIPGQLPLDFVANEFNRLLEKKPQIDMFNASFDIRVLRHNQVPSIYCTWDGYLGARLLNENEQKGMNRLKPLHQKYVLKGKGDAFTFDELFKGIKFTLVPLESAYLYAAHDPVITTELCDYQRQFLREDAETEDMRQLYWVFQNIEMPCVSVVADMEDNGIELDLDYNAQLKTKYHALLDEREKAFIESYKPYADKIAELPLGKVDNPINIGSPQQLGVLLYDVMGCDLFYDKKKKQYTRSTSEEALSGMDNDVAKAILSYREFSTLVSTFIDKLPECVNPNDKRIHCKFNQYGADTGRFSSNDPNMQNIPSKNHDIRKMFKATDDEYLVETETNVFTISRWDEVMSDGGWVLCDRLNVGDDLDGNIIKSISVNGSFRVLEVV